MSIPDCGASANPISSKAESAASFILSISICESGRYVPPSMPGLTGRNSEDKGAALAAVRAARPPDRPALWGGLSFILKFLR